MLTRSSALAVGVGVGYLLVVENLIGIIAPDATPYLPASISLLAFHRRDITS